MFRGDTLYRNHFIFHEIITIDGRRGSVVILVKRVLLIVTAIGYTYSFRKRANYAIDDLRFPGVIANCDR